MKLGGRWSKTQGSVDQISVVSGCWVIATEQLSFSGHGYMLCSHVSLNGPKQWCIYTIYFYWWAYFIAAAFQLNFEPRGLNIEEFLS